MSVIDKYMWRHVLLLPDFLAFDAVFEVKSSERSDRDAFLSELTME